MTKLSWTGFSKKTLQERKEHLKNNALLSQENQDLLDKDQQLADRLNQFRSSQGK